MKSSERSQSFRNASFFGNKGNKSLALATPQFGMRGQGLADITGRAHDENKRASEEAWRQDLKMQMEQQRTWKHEQEKLEREADEKVCCGNSS